MASAEQKHETVKNELDSLVNDFLSYAIRRSSAIKRYNTSKVIIDQNDLEHMGAVTIIAMLFSDYFNRIGIRNDAEKVMRIAVTHDLEEVVIGDVPHDAKYDFGEHSEKLRSALERLSSSTVETMYGKIRHDDMRARYMDLYREQKERRSVEAKIVKLADYADVILYCENETRMGNRDLDHHRQNAQLKFNDMLNQMLDEHDSQAKLNG